MSTLEQAASEGFRDWVTSLTPAEMYDFDSEGRGYKKDTMHMMRMAWNAARALAPVVTESVTAAEPVADITPGRVKFLADIMADCRAARDIPTGGLYRSIAYDQWHEARARLHLAIDALALYAAPPAPAVQPLTDDQIRELWDRHIQPFYGKSGINPIVFARAIERAHGIKPTEGEPR